MIARQRAAGLGSRQALDGWVNALPWAAIVLLVLGFVQFPNQRAWAAAVVIFAAHSLLEHRFGLGMRDQAITWRAVTLTAAFAASAVPLALVGWGVGLLSLAVASVVAIVVDHLVPSDPRTVSPSRGSRR